MPELIDQLGIQSYCFRVYQQVDDLLAAYTACGIDRIELFPGHYDPDQHAAHDDFLSRLARQGMRLSTFGVVGLHNESSARKVFEFAREAGFEVINADLREQDFGLAEALCEEYQLRVMVHNHGRKHRWGSRERLAELLARTSPRVGLCLDTALMLDAGDDPLEAARQFRSRLYGLHLKDYIFDRTGRGGDVLIGTGNLDLPAMLGFLKETTFDGVLTLEYEGDEQSPVPATKTCVEIVRQTWAAL